MTETTNQKMMIHDSFNYDGSSGDVRNDKSPKISLHKSTNKFFMNNRRSINEDTSKENEAQPEEILAENSKEFKIHHVNTGAGLLPQKSKKRKKQSMSKRKEIINM